MEVFHYVVDRMWNGNIRLSKIFWGYFFIGGFLWGIAIGLTRPNTIQQTVVLFFSCAYYVVISVGIWRAAGKFQGNVWWAAISKVYGIGGMIYAVTVGSSLLVIALGLSNEGTTGKGSASAVDSVNRTSSTVSNEQEFAAPTPSEADRRVDEQLAIMDTLRPAWRDTVRSREFQAWLASQPKGFRDAFDSADTAAKLIPFIDLYSQYGVASSAKTKQPAANEPRQKTAEEVYAEKARQAMIDSAAERLSR